MDRGFRARTMVNTLLGSFNVALGLTYVWVTKWTIDVATGVSGVQSLRLPILCLVLLTLLRITTGIAARWISATLGIKVQNRMRQRLFERGIGSHWEGIREFQAWCIKVCSLLGFQRNCVEAQFCRGPVTRG